MTFKKGSPAKLESTADGWKLSGELDTASAPALAKNSGSMLEAESVTLDLSGVSHASSAGVALLLEWLRQARQQGCKISYANPPEQLVSLARFGGVEELLGFGGSAA